MNKFILCAILLIILIIGTIQQTTSTQAKDPFQQFNNAIKRNLNEQNPNPIVVTMEERLRKQVVIWTSVGLSIVLYFSVIAIINMSNPKSSILYAKYDTTRGGNEY